MFNLCLCGLFIAGSCVVLILYYSVLLFILLVIVGIWKKNGFLVTKIVSEKDWMLLMSESLYAIIMTSCFCINCVLFIFE